MYVEGMRNDSLCVNSSSISAEGPSGGVVCQEGATTPHTHSAFRVALQVNNINTVSPLNLMECGVYPLSESPSDVMSTAHTHSAFRVVLQVNQSHLWA